MKKGGKVKDDGEIQTKVFYRRAFSSYASNELLVSSRERAL